MITAKQARNLTKTQTMIECHDQVESAIKSAACHGETCVHVTISMPILDDEIAISVCSVLVQNDYTVYLVKTVDKIKTKNHYTFMIHW